MEGPAERTETPGKLQPQTFVPVLMDGEDTTENRRVFSTSCCSCERLQTCMAAIWDPSRHVRIKAPGLIIPSIPGLAGVQPSHPVSAGLYCSCSIPLCNFRRNNSSNNRSKQAVNPHLLAGFISIICRASLEYLQGEDFLPVGDLEQI